MKIQKIRPLIYFIILILVGCSLGEKENKNSSDSENSDDSLKTVQACFNNKNDCYELEIADNDETRSLGLMNRDHLDKDKGMLFVFPETGAHNFWMKDTHIPLDILWISEDKTIVDLLSNILPCEKEDCPVYSTSKKALYAVELNAGQILDKGLLIGGKVEFSLK